MTVGGADKSIEFQSRTLDGLASQNVVNVPVLRPGYRVAVPLGLIQLQNVQSLKQLRDLIRIMEAHAGRAGPAVTEAGPALSGAE
jgi:hypothetical protein